MSVISSHHFCGPARLLTHAHPHAHIILPITGEFYIRFQDREHSLTLDELGFVPPGVPHTYSCSGRALTLNIPAEMIKSSDLILLTESSARKIDERLAPLISLVKQETLDSSGHSEAVRYLFYYLYDKLVEEGQRPSLKYIQENYAAGITIRELAEMENYNVSYYTEWFKRTMGCLPSEYLRMVRLDKAKEILATTFYRVEDVAMQVGYCSSSAFARAFREAEGISPNAYRKKAREGRNTPRLTSESFRVSGGVSSDETADSQ